MSVNDDELVMYADGELEPDRAEQIRLALANSSALRERLNVLEADKGNIRAALDLMLEDSPAPDLVAHIDGAALSETQPGSTEPTTRSAPTWRNVGLSAIAAATIAWLGAAWFYQSQPVAAAGWLADVAAYQKLYARETLPTARVMPKERLATATKLSAALGAPVKIPQLSSLGLEFKRGQILSAGGEPLVQLAYLPATGNPIVICVLASGGDNSSLTRLNAHGINMIHWQHPGLSYVVAGEQSYAELAQIAEEARQQI